MHSRHSDPRPRARRLRPHAALSTLVLGRLRAVLAWTALAILASPASAEDVWTPAEPLPELGGWDWVRIDSGEWLKGEFVVLQSKVITFDSDEFDEVEFDWKDVLDLRLARPRIFRCTNNRIYSGKGELRDKVLRIHLADGEIVEIPQDEVVSITYTEEYVLGRWSVQIGANLAARSGNSDQQDLGANALISRNATYTRWENRYNGSFSQVDGDSTTNNHRASTLLDLMVTQHFFVRVPTFEFYADEFQNIDERYTTGVGIGYEPIDNDFAEFQISTGVAAQRTENSGGTGSTDAAVLAGAELSLDLPRDLDLDLRYNLQLLVTDIGRTAHSTSTVLSFEVWDPIDLDVGFYWDRIEQPEPDSDGDTPKSDDLRLTVGLSVEF